MATGTTPPATGRIRRVADPTTTDVGVVPAAMSAAVAAAARQVNIIYAWKK